jgi:hypothetical protein
LEISTHNSITHRLQARDFHVSEDETGTDAWTAEKLDHVLAAINGAPVIITVDARTNFTVIGATIALSNARDELVVKTVDNEDETFRFDFSALGSEIIPIGPIGALTAARASLRAAS